MAWMHPAQLRNGGNYVVTVDWGGLIIRVADQALAVEHADEAKVYRFTDGLRAIEIETSLGEPGSSGGEALSIPLVMVWPVDVGALEAAGKSLATATAEVAWVPKGGDWVDRAVLVEGPLVQPIYNRPGEELRASVEVAAFDDVALVPEADARITATTWPSSPDGSQGIYIPMPFGRAGNYRTTAGSQTTSGSPAIPVAMSGSNVDKLAIGTDLLDADTVIVFDSTGSDTLAVEYESDGLGNTRAVVDITSSSLTRTDSEFWVGFNSGGGLVDEDGQLLEGAGDLALWLLRRSSQQVDIAAWKGLRDQLNQYLLAGFIDDAGSPWKWLARYALPLLPLACSAGPRGLRPTLWRWQARPGDVEERFIVGEGGVTRRGGLGYSRRRRDVRNEIRLEFAPRARTGEFRRHLTLTGAPSDDDTIRPSLHAAHSQSMYGLASDALKAQVVYDETTALRILHDQVLRHGFLRRSGVLVVPWARGRVEEGAIVEVGDPDVGLTEPVYALVHGTRRLGSVVELPFTLLADPLQRIGDQAA